MGDPVWQKTCILKKAVFKTSEYALPTGDQWHAYMIPSRLSALKTSKMSLLRT